MIRKGIGFESYNEDNEKIVHFNKGLLGEKNKVNKELESIS